MQRIRSRVFNFVLMMSLNSVLQAGTEIEVKMQLDDVQIGQLRGWLAKNATTKGTTQQSEIYLNNPDKTFYFFAKEGFTDALGSLRVRCTPKGDYVCYKFRHIDPVTGKTSHRDEYETKVADGKVMVELLKHLGYTDRIEFKKQREAFIHGDFEIVIDTVANLGIFVEVELQTTETTPKEGLKKVQDFIKAMGINSYKSVDRSYIHMLLNPGHNFASLVTL